MSRYPLRVTGEQWNDIKHHYQDADWDDLPPLCECEDPECEGGCGEVDDHDRRFSDLYDTQNGDIGDEHLPPF